MLAAPTAPVVWWVPIQIINHHQNKSRPKTPKFLGVWGLRAGQHTKHLFCLGAFAVSEQQQAGFGSAPMGTGKSFICDPGQPFSARIPKTAETHPQLPNEAKAFFCLMSSMTAAQTPKVFMSRRPERPPLQALLPETTPAFDMSSVER